MRTHALRVQLDERGHLVMPPELAERFGFVDGATVRVEEDGDAIAIGRATASLSRVYVEPTTVCNLRCRTCIRNVGDEPPGLMAAEAFARITDGQGAQRPAARG
jgi:bifunctional DNA-binding transcriptional regulator/antitoxin component of YhaV-PrlF toxin-antitoxin module